MEAADETYLSMSDLHRHQSTLISEVLERLLTVGIADPDTDIRETLFCCLDSSFDSFLAQQV